MLKVRNLQDDTWQVYDDNWRESEESEESEENFNSYEHCSTIYQGSLSDCEAYIRLSKKGRLC